MGAPEVCECRITPDLMLLAHSLVLGAVNLGNLDLKLKMFTTLSKSNHGEI